MSGPSLCTVYGQDKRVERVRNAPGRAGRAHREGQQCTAGCTRAVTSCAVLCMTSVRCVNLWAPQSKILIFKGAITEKMKNRKRLYFSREAIICSIKKSNISDNFKDLLQNSISGIQCTSRLQLLSCHYVTG